MFTGIDYHKRYLVATTLSKNGRVLKRERVATQREPLEAFVEGLPKNERIAMEATGNWYAFYELLEGGTREVVLSHPLKTKAIASARIKTDAIDSKMLAELLRVDLLPTAYMPPRHIRDIREVIRYRASLVVFRTALKNKLHALLAKNGIIMTYADILGKAARKYMTGLSLRECYRMEIDGYLRIATTLEQEICTINAVITRLVGFHPEAALLMSVPGIGYYSALLIFGEIGDIGRFPSAKHLCSYAGLVPSVHSSGDKTRYGAITKQGSRWLRWALVESVHHAIRQDRRLEECYRRIAARHGKHTARVAVARNILTIMYHMLRDKRSFKVQSGCPQSFMVSR